MSVENLWRNFNIPLIGDPETGKSSARRLYCKFQNDENPVKLGVESGCEHEQFGKHTVAVNIYEIPSFRSYRSLTMSYYRGSSAALLFFDVTRRETFDSLPRWIEIARWTYSPNMEFYLIATKKDLPDREVSREEAEKFAKDNNLVYREIDANNENDVKKLFRSAAQKIYDNIQSGRIDETDPIHAVLPVKKRVQGIWRFF